MKLDKIKKIDNLSGYLLGISLLVWMVSSRGSKLNSIADWTGSISFIICIGLSGFLYILKRKGNVPKGDYRPGIPFLIGMSFVGFFLIAAAILKAPSVLLMVLILIMAAACIGFSIWAFSNRKKLREKGRMK